LDGSVTSLATNSPFPAISAAQSPANHNVSANALRHLLEFSPNDGKARQTLAAIETNPETCHRH
jgi:hypothetical protein